MLRVPLEWLKEFVPVRMTPDQLAHRLTMAGFEVTGIDTVDPADGGAGGQPVFSLEITPNRADCLSILGLAREVAAISGQKLTLPPVKSPARQKGSGGPALDIRIEDREGCRLYVGRLLEGVKIGPSPAWMVKRLAGCGIRSINNVVDITNYVLLAYGQPLHAFDADCLKDQTIVIRRAKAGETMITLDGEARALSPEILVIADAARAVAVAGVMGGRDAQVTDATTRIVLESAWFEPVRVRRAGRALGLSSESSYRFERGVDLGGVDASSRLAASLIAEFSGGRETAVKAAGQRTPTRTSVTIEPARVKQWLGPGVTTQQATAALTRLGFSVRKQRLAWRVGVPSFRRDVKQDVDLIEEIARLVGYDKLPETVPSASMDARAGGGSSYARTMELRRLLAGSGLSEAITWSLVSEQDLERVKWPQAAEALRVRNPLSRDHLVLRPTLLVGMLRAVARNFSQGADGVRLFELGHVFVPQEQPQIGVILSGLWERQWQSTREADLFRLKGILEQFASRGAGQMPEAETAAPAWAEPGTGVRLTLDGKELGVLGQVAQRVTAGFDVERPVWFGELGVEALLPRKVVQAAPLNLFPPVKRDLSFLVDKQVGYAQVEALIRATGGTLAQRVELIDRYDGSQVPKSKHSLTVSIDYRDPSRTLTSAEVDALHRTIGEALVRDLGAQLR